ncbi:MAG TPA: monofunctional biosynthetic peptidoglycan transglycosylase [Candidatus Acidoferrum sp.]
MLDAKLISARWYLGELSGKEMTEIACQALELGHGGKNLRRLAGLTNPARRDITEIADGALREFGVVVPITKHDAALWMARWVAKEIVEGRIQPYAGACRIWLSYSGEASELKHWVDLATDFEVAAETSGIENAEQQIVQAARSLRNDADAAGECPNTPAEMQLSRRRTSLLRSILRWLVIAIALLWSLAALLLVAARWIDPPTTAVHIQRRLQSWIHGTPYHERYKFIPLTQISPDLQHAVVAAEDSRFYQHHGFDWHEIQIAAQDDLDGDRTRGASTITQQLVKNLFFGTGRSFLRKGAEVTLVPVAEFVLGKRRILEIYLNVVEWGSGIYGADSACRYYDETSARNIDRQQAARLAAILPAPLKRRPARMNNYSAIILKRMAQMGW